MLTYNTNTKGSCIQYWFSLVENYTSYYCKLLENCTGKYCVTAKMTNLIPFPKLDVQAVSDIFSCNLKASDLSSMD
jgi:hypothetical protein